MEEVNCLLCGCAERRVRFHGRDRLHHLPGEFTLVECTRCGFLYLSPRPDEVEIQRYYPEDYLPFRRAVYEETSVIRRFDRLFGLHRRCQAVQRFASKGSLLDVGCATGDFLAVMRSYPGWSVRGLEPHAGAASQARVKYGLTIDNVPLDTAEYHPDTFDAVTLWDVLEHVPGPLQALRRLHGILRPNGVIVLGLPNRDSLDAAIFRSYWAGLDIPRHCSVFSVAHIRWALREAGFGDPELLNLSGGFHTFALSMRFWIDGRGCGSVVGRCSNLGLAMIHSMPVRLGSFPYFSLLKWLKRGPTMVVVARKETSAS